MAITKSRYWTAILYPENMKTGWKDEIGDILGVPYCYCIHSKDSLGQYDPKESEQYQRKTHVHLIVVFSNTTTYNHCLQVLQGLSAEGKKALNTCQACISIRNSYEYLIHNTETSKKQGKYLYDVSERISGNNFDIGAYEQISLEDKTKMAHELCDYISSEKICNFVDFYDGAMKCFGDEYFEIIKLYSGLFERLCKGNYHKEMTTGGKEKGT